MTIWSSFLYGSSFSSPSSASSPCRDHGQAYEHKKSVHLQNNCTMKEKGRDWDPERKRTFVKRERKQWQTEHIWWVGRRKQEKSNRRKRTLEIRLDFIDLLDFLRGSSSSSSWRDQTCEQRKYIIQWHNKGKKNATKMSKGEREREREKEKEKDRERKRWRT